MRRSFATLGFSSGPGGPARGVGARADLMLDDSAMASSHVGSTEDLCWDRGPGASPVAGETVEAVLRLADAIRREAEALEELAPRARAEARRLVREEADLAAAARSLGDADLADALGLLGPPIASLVCDIAATALGVSLAAVRAGASARGFTQAAREAAELARVLDEAWGQIEGLVVSLEERSGDTAVLAAALRERGTTLGRDGCADLPGVAVAGSEVALLRRFALDASEAAMRVAAASDEMALTVRALSDRLIAVVRGSSLADRRKASRVAIDLPCEIVVSGGGARGRALDLSVSGASIALDEAQELGPGQPLSFRLPDTPPIAGSVVDADGAVLRISFDLRHEANAAAAQAVERRVSDAGWTPRED